jgi:hypothetical protein
MDGEVQHLKCERQECEMQVRARGVMVGSRVQSEKQTSCVSLDRKIGG